MEKRGIRTEIERETDGGVAFYCLQSENGLSAGRESTAAGLIRPSGLQSIVSLMALAVKFNVSG